MNETDKRKAIVQFRVTRAELAKIKAEAKRQKLSVTELVRWHIYPVLLGDTEPRI